MDNQETRETIPVLLVEDDEDDVRLTQRAFSKGRILNKLYVVGDGEEAMEFLKQRGRYVDSSRAPQPGIIMLDLNMPRMSGREVLKKIKGDKDLQHIPIIILTTSDQESDVWECYKSGANTFITKPVEFDKFLDAVVTIGKYWLEIAELPTGENPVRDDLP